MITVSDLRDLLKGQTITATTADNLSTIGGRVFLDGSAVAALNDLARIVESWRGVHVPTYGAPIPGTGNVQNLTAQNPNDWEDVVVPTGQQVVAVQFAGLYNADPGVAATVDVALTDADGTAYVAASLTVPPQTFVNAFDLGSQPITLDANVSMQWRVKTGVHSAVSLRTYTIDVVG